MFGTEPAGAKLMADFFSSRSLDSSTAWTAGLVVPERAAAA